MHRYPPPRPARPRRRWPRGPLALALLALSLFTAGLLAACASAAPVAAPVSPGDASHDAQAGGAQATPPAGTRLPATATPAAGAPPASAPASEREAVVVVLDPGHGGDEAGASANGVVEKDSNLDMALRVEPLLRQAGVEVVLTRSDDSRAFHDDLSTGFRRNRRDRQARTDIANEAGAAAFVSIHSNGIGDARVRGLETYYNSQRTFADRNRALAGLIHDAVLEEAATSGRELIDRGVRDSTCIYIYRENCYSIFVLGPERVTIRQEVLDRGLDPARLGFLPGQDEIRTRPTQMPGALVELLFITNPDDAALLRTEAVRDAMARGIARGILAFLESEGVLPATTG